MADTMPLRGKVRFSLGLKLTLGLVLIIGIFFTAVNTYNILSHRKGRRAEALSNSETIARLVAGAILDELGQGTPLDGERVKRVVRNFLQFGLILNKKNRDLAYTVVVGPEGEYIVGRAKTELVELPAGESPTDELDILRAIARLDGRLGSGMRAKRFPLQVGNKIVGKLIVGTSLARLESEARSELRRSGLLLLGTVLLLVVYSLLMLNSLVIKPLKEVSVAMDSVRGGILDHEVHLRRTDELGALADTYNFMIGGLREQERLKEAFNKYVSEKVYAKFREGAVTLTGETREATILFSDIRSFTNLSEQLSAAEVVEMLNEYFSEMVDIVLKYDGFINKFIGDAMMAIYNVPVDQDYPELRAVQTGIDMMSALAVLNEKRQQRGMFPIRIGIGINTGPVVAGNIGHQKRLEYTVIGDAVNLASRIESQTKVAGATLLVSHSTYMKVAPWVVADALPPVKVKGKAEPVALYAVKGLKTPIQKEEAALPTPA